MRNIKDAIVATGAVYVSVNASECCDGDSTGWQPLQEHEEGVLDMAGCTKLTTRHAMTLVGFDEQHFIAQNSWGEEWGEDGMALLTHDSVANSTQTFFSVTGMTAR